MSILSNLKICETIPNEEGDLKVYKVPQKETMRDETKMIAKYEIGTPNQLNMREKVVIFVGATGSGKSTLINGITNFVLGVNWNDQYRLKLIVEDTKESDAESKTKFITAYSIHPVQGSKLTDILTVVDTPGFGDTRGIDRDKEITAQIKEYFSLSPPTGIDQLHAVVFVARSSESRLTPTQKYIFDSILAVFGKDMGTNIHVIATFGDAKKPPVQKAIEAAGVPHISFLKASNSALYADNDDMFGELFWKMGHETYEKFFDTLLHAEPKSLQLTQEVLKERQRLETVVRELQPQIQRGLSKIDEIQEERKILELRESEILANKKFKYTVTETKQKKINLGKHEYVTNCINCNVTCHYPCKIARDEDKYKCWAMDSERMDSRCRICEEKCSWRDHVHNPYRFELYTEDVERTSEELKEKYEKAVKGRDGVRANIGYRENELKETHRKVVKSIREARRCLEHLQMIALKPNPLSEVDYIDLLIEAERSEGKKGFKNRIQALEKLREQAVIISKMKAVDITDNFLESQWDIWREKK